MATVSINVFNNPPTAADDSVSVLRGTTLSVAAPGLLGNDSDVDGDSLNPVLVSPPSNGTLLGPRSDGSFEYTPNNGFVGSDSFGYQSSDGLAQSNLATVTVAVLLSDSSYTTVSTLDSTIESTVTGTYAVYRSVMETARADYQAAIVDAEIGYQADMAAAQAVYHTALAELEATRSEALTAARAVYATAVSQSNEVNTIALVTAQVAYDDADIAAQETHDQAVSTALAVYFDALTTADTTYRAAVSTAGTQLAAAIATYDATVADLTRQENELWDACAADPACTEPDPQALADIDAARTVASAALDASTTNFDLAIAAADTTWRAGYDQAQAVLDQARVDAETVRLNAVTLANTVLTAAQADAESIRAAAVATAEGTLVVHESAAYSTWLTGVTPADATLQMAQEVADTRRNAALVAADAVLQEVHNSAQTDWTAGMAATAITQTGDVFAARAADEIGLAKMRAIDNPAPDDAPEYLEFPVGHVDAVLQEVTPGGSAALTFFLPPWQPVNTYYKFGPTPDDPAPHWYEFLFDGTTGAEIFADRIVVHLVDGERGDDDLAANGQIVDPGGAGNNTNPGVVQFTALNYAEIEGTGAGTRNATISVNRSGGQYGAVTVGYAAVACTAPSCAAAGRDYNLLPGAVWWRDGEAGVKTFDVSIVRDDLDEVNETVDLVLTEATGQLRIGAVKSAKLTILDDDGPGLIHFSSAAYVVPETGGQATITVKRTGGQGAVSVNYGVGACSAARCATQGSGKDFLLNSGTLTWAAKDTADQTIAVSILDDLLVEGDEVVKLVLSNPTGGAALGPSSAADLTIEDDDAPGVLWFSEPSYQFEENAGQVTITVKRVGGRAGAVGVSYGTSNGTATAGSDYTLSSGTLSWASGDASPKTFTVAIADDSTEEADETVQLRLSNATGGATLGTTPVLLTILDNDGAGVLQFSSASYFVREDVGNATITVERTRGSKGTVSVNYATSAACGPACNEPLDEIARATDDYTHRTGTLTFAEGVTSQTFTVPISDELLIEKNEFLNLNLAPPTGGAKLGAPANARLTILNDDGQGQLQLDADEIALWESAGATGVTIVRVGGKSGSLTADVLYKAGWSNPATFYTDFDAALGTYTFAEGVTEKIVPITVIQDTTQEPSETFNLELRLSTSSFAHDRATVTIMDDDDPTWDKVIIGAPDPDAAEPGTNTGSFWISRPNTGSALTVNLKIGGSATNGSDYETLQTSVPIAAGSPGKALTMRPKDDSLIEDDETVEVTVAGGVGYSPGEPSSATVTIRDKVCRARLRNVTHNGGSPIPQGSTVTYTANLRNVNAAEANGLYSWKFRDRQSNTWTDLLTNVPQNSLTVTEDVARRGQYQVALNSCDELSTALVSVEIVPPSVSIGNVTVTEGNSGTISAVFTVSLSHRSPQEVTVRYATANNSAVAPDDYTAANGTVRFAAGTTSQTIAVQVRGDTMYEPTERFFVDLSGPTAATLDSRRSRATGTITNDDAQPTISINGATVVEGNSGSKDAAFTVGLSNPSTETVRVKYKTTDGSAKAPGDYTASLRRITSGRSARSARLFVADTPA